MFYSYDLLCRHKNGKFSVIWLAANKKKVNKCLCLKVNIANSCDEIAKIVMVQEDADQPEKVRLRFSLYLSGMLMHGACLVYRQQLVYFLQDLGMIWENLAKPKNKMIELPENMKSRRGRTDDEDSDDEAPKKKRAKKSKTKKAAPTLEELLVPDWEKSLAIVDINLDEVQAPLNNTMHQIPEGDVPQTDEVNAFAGLFGTFDNVLLNQLIEGVPDLHEIDPALVEEQGMQMNPEESYIDVGPLVQEPRTRLSQKDGPAEKQFENIVEIPPLEMEMHLNEVGLSTVNQVIEDVVNGNCEPQEQEKEIEPQVVCKDKRAVLFTSEKRIVFSPKQLLNDGKANSQFQAKHWSDLADVEVDKVNFEQILNEPVIPLRNEELQATYAHCCFMEDDYFADVTEASTDITRGDRSSVKSLKNRSRTPQGRTSAVNGLEEESFGNRLVTDESCKSMEMEIPEMSVVPGNIPELPSVMEEEIAPEHPAEQSVAQAGGNLMDVPQHEIFPMEVEVPDEEDPFKFPPAKKRRLHNTSQISQESASSETSSNGRRRESVMARVEQLWSKHSRVTFEHLCPRRVSSRMEAAKVFYILLELHKMKKICVNQKKTTAYSIIDICRPMSK